MESIQEHQQNQEQFQSVKPAIKTPLLLLHSFLQTIFINLFLGIISAGIIVRLLFTGNVLAGLSLGIGIFAVIWIIIFFVKQATIKKTEYKFFSNRVEFFEGFLTKNRKTIHYEKFSNIGQRKGIIEGWFGLGTIFVDTAGSSTKGHELAMNYLENPDQIYDWLTKIISKKSNTQNNIQQPTKTTSGN